MGWWGWEEDILPAPESEFQLQAAYSPSLPPQRPALVPSISRLRPRATLDSAGLSPDTDCPVEFSARIAWRGDLNMFHSFYLGQKGWQKGDLYSRKRVEFLVLATRSPLFHSPPLTGISWGAGIRVW